VEKEFPFDFHGALLRQPYETAQIRENMAKNPKAKSIAQLFLVRPMNRPHR
jgi:hypothetical protein